jgi:tRNA-dihydrouridine synthase B
MNILTIGTLRLENRVILAPMAGVTDLPFRRIIRRFHRGLNCTEMLSSQSLINKHRRTRDLMLFLDADDSPVSVQLLGRNPAIMAEAARIVQDAGAQILDINMGCSVRKVLKQGEGAALLKEPLVAREIIRRIIKAVTIPVTVKMRKGFQYGDTESLAIARLAEEEGAGAVIIHGRTADQGFSGHADWTIVREIKELLTIPVIGNGDLVSPENADSRLKESCCDGLMMGRATLGNPWILRDTEASLQGRGKPQCPTLGERFEIAALHIDASRHFFKDLVAHKRIRKHLAWYIKGLPLATRVRELVFRTTSFAELQKLLDDYREMLLDVQDRERGKASSQKWIKIDVDEIWRKYFK